MLVKLRLAQIVDPYIHTCLDSCEQRIQIVKKERREQQEDAECKQGVNSQCGLKTPKIAQGGMVAPGAAAQRNVYRYDGLYEIVKVTTSRTTASRTSSAVPLFVAEMSKLQASSNSYVAANRANAELEGQQQKIKHRTRKSTTTKNQR